MIDLSMIKDIYKTAIVFYPDDVELYKEFIREAEEVYPERADSWRFWEGHGKDFLTYKWGGGIRTAFALACKSDDFCSDYLNWCDEKWYQDRGFTVLECCDLIIEDELEELSDTDINWLFFGGV